MESIFAYRSFWQEAEVINRMGELGIDTVCIFPAHTLCSLGVSYSRYRPTWIGPGRYDFGSLEEQIEDVIAGNDRARILCMVDLNTPVWWPKIYNNKGSCDSFYHIGRVAGDERWRTDTKDYLQAMLRFTQARWGERMAGYILACGGTCEWLDCSLGQESESREKAWREWMVKRGKPDPVDIPPRSVREHVTHDMLRDPVGDGLAVDYWRFVQELNSGVLLEFARAAQEVLEHKAAVGAFYGYIFELAEGRMVSEGHLDWDRVYASEDLDFFIAPATYCDRGNGGAGGVMMPTGTVGRYGKSYLHEIDHRTHTARLEPGKDANMLPLWGMEQWKNTAESVAGLEREFALCLTQKTSLWWFDMFGGWYDDEQVQAAMRRMAGIWQEYRGLTDGDVSEIAVITDRESALYVDQNDPRVSRLYSGLRAELGRLGAPYRCYSMSDLEWVDWSQYRMVILPGVYVVDAVRQRHLEKYLLCDGRTVIWGDRPGVIDGQQYDEAYVQRLTGCAMGADLPVVCEMDGWRSVWAGLEGITRDRLGGWAEAAGVHIYCDAEEPVYASEHFLGLHTARGGKRTFKLRRAAVKVRELFSDRVVAEGVSEFEDELAGPSTVLYRLDFPEE